MILPAHAQDRERDTTTARARTHALDITRRNALHIAHIVFVGQIAGDDVAHNLHVAVAMGSKTCSRRNPVFVDHTQITPAHKSRIVVFGERERMLALQPTMISLAALGSASNVQHTPLLFNLLIKF